jgi:hypothetical protein
VLTHDSAPQSGACGQGGGQYDVSVTPPTTAGAVGWCVNSALRFGPASQSDLRGELAAKLPAIKMILKAPSLAPGALESDRTPAQARHLRALLSTDRRQARAASAEIARLLHALAHPLKERELAAIVRAYPHLLSFQQLFFSQSACGAGLLGPPFVVAFTKAWPVGTIYVTAAQVAALRFTRTLTFRTRSARSLPSGDRIAVLPYGSYGYLGSAPSADLKHPVPLTSAGVPIAVHRLATQPETIPSGFVGEFNGDAAPPAGVCQVVAKGLPTTVNMAGLVVRHVQDFSQVLPGTPIACASISFATAAPNSGDPDSDPLVEAAIVLNARDPAEPLGPLPGATPVAGHPGIVNEPAQKSDAKLGPDASAVTARRVGNGWVIVESAGSLSSRINILDHLETCVRLTGPPCR